MTHQTPWQIIINPRFARSYPIHTPTTRAAWPAWTPLVDATGLPRATIVRTICGQIPLTIRVLAGLMAATESTFDQVALLVRSNTPQTPPTEPPQTPPTEPPHPVIDDNPPMGILQRPHPSKPRHIETDPEPASPPKPTPPATYNDDPAWRRYHIDYAWWRYRQSLRKQQSIPANRPSDRTDLIPAIINHRVMAEMLESTKPAGRDDRWWRGKDQSQRTTILRTHLLAGTEPPPPATYKLLKDFSKIWKS